MATIGTLGTDPDYASLLAGRQNPRLLMAQKLMDLGAAPATNSTQSSFWANLLNQGGRGALAGYLYNKEGQREHDEGEKQKTEADAFQKRMQDLLNSPSPKDGGGGTTTAPAPGPRADAGGGGGSLAQAVLMNESGGRMTPGIYGDGGGAAGPMQVHAGALADVNRAQGTNYTHEQLAADPAIGKKVGEAYLAMLRQQFGRDDYALGAYNAGPGTMRAAIANGQGISGLPPGAQQYVAKALSRMQGRQADASPAPGSAIDALMAGVNQPKPRGVQLAENLLPNRATDAPTPILPDMADAQGTAVPRVPVSSAALDAPGAAAPAMPSPTAASVPGANLDLPPPPDAAALPLPSPATAPLPDPATTPPIAAAVPPRADVPVVPAPDAASVPAPALGGAAPTPAVVPPPDAAAVPAPTPALVPDNPMANADPASLAAFNGAPPAPAPAVVPPPDAASVQPPTPAVVPPPAAATLPPLQGPPVPPGLLARRLVQPNDNASDALNAASLAAAQRGENFDPTRPTGPQLAAPLWAGQLTPAGAPLLTPAGATGGPTGTQLAGPLVTPTSGPGDAGATPPVDTNAAGGPNKGAAPGSQPSSTAGLQDRADQLAALAQEAAGSSNPRIRAYAGVLQAQSAALQHRIDHSETLQLHEQGRQDARLDRQQTHADAEAGRAESAADRKERIRIEEERLKLEQDKPAQAATAAQRTEDRELALKGLRWKADSNRTELEEIPNSKPPGGPYTGKSVPAEDRNTIDRLHDSIANGTANEHDKRLYSLAYNSLKNGTPTEIPDPQNPSRNIRVPGQPADLTGYAPPPYHDTTVMPGKPATEAERKIGGFARRMDLANSEIDKLGSQTFGDVAAGKVPMVGNYLTSNQGQQFQTAAKAWVLAKLRTESGAAFGEGEWEREFSTYFPQPGDTPDRIALKKRLRDMETENMRRDAGNAYTAEPAAAGGGGAGGQSNLPPEGSVIRQGGRTYKIVNGQAVAQ